MGNLRAMPDPVISQRPGPTDWVNKNGAVFDGDLVTLRNNAWNGTTIAHSWALEVNQPGGTEVKGVRIKNEKNAGPKPLYLAKVRMDNAYTFCVRKVVFDPNKKAWVLPSWHAWKDRKPLGITDHVVFLCPNDPSLVMGTKVPPTYGNNGDYKVKLVPFPLTTQAELTGHTLGGTIRRLVSLGFWREDKHNVDFLNQSRCVWSFKNIYDSKQNLSFGGSPINIRNMWTEIKDREMNIWDAVGGAQIGIIAGIINSTWKGGRNLTQAAGSEGASVKLALSNKDRDDKAGWIIDGWHGNRYPVQRALVPAVAPPPAPEGEDLPPQEEGTPPPTIVVPNLEEQISNPPPVTPGMVFSPETGTTITEELEKSTQRQNPENLLDMISRALFGDRWSNISFTQQFILAAALALGIIMVADEGIKTAFSSFRSL